MGTFITLSYDGKSYTKDTDSSGILTMVVYHPSSLKLTSTIILMINDVRGVLYQGIYLMLTLGLMSKLDQVLKNPYFMNTYLNNENNIKIEEILASKKDIKNYSSINYLIFYKRIHIIVRLYL